MYLTDNSKSDLLLMKDDMDHLFIDLFIYLFMWDNLLRILLVSRVMESCT